MKDLQHVSSHQGLDISSMGIEWDAIACNMLSPTNLVKISSDTILENGYLTKSVSKMRFASTYIL